ncbi:MAG: hypothetical protein M5U10_16585 [Candidatus Methanoperedens sp.]|nr:hypothetical protein [Candidatus Methanoperedens nitroreducens]MDJ1423513.1 hypothetical protein [Candidatus Methanoperedens sp.]
MIGNVVGNAVRSTAAIPDIYNRGLITMFKEALSGYKKILKYSIYVLILLNILDIISTYIGIKYFNAYEANEKAAYLFDLFGILLPSGLKILIVIILGYTIRSIWKKTEFLLLNTCGWMNSMVVVLNLNVMFIITFLNFYYFLIIINNINIIYYPS